MSEISSLSSQAMADAQPQADAGAKPGAQTKADAQTKANVGPKFGAESKTFDAGAGGSRRRYASDVAFSGAVKAVQARKGSRAAYARVEAGGSWETRITSEIAEFIEAQTTAFLATANAEGQPYIQHRGGPPGFLRVLDEHTLGFVDFTGNRQYVTTGNLQENPKACLFLMDYANRQRVKIWGEARVVEGDAELIAKLMPAGYKAKAEQVILFSVATWDANCPQHIPQKFDAADVDRAVASFKGRIAELELENARLKQLLADREGAQTQPTGSLLE